VTLFVKQIGQVGEENHVGTMMMFSSAFFFFIKRCRLNDLLMVKWTFSLGENLLVFF